MCSGVLSSSATHHSPGVLQPVHKIDDKAGLLDLVDSMPEGLRTTDIADSYETVHKDVDDLVQTGEVIAARSTDNRGMVLFPRRGRLVCSLSGTVSVEQGARFVSTSTDLTKEIDRGNVIVINGVACRVSTNTTDKPEGTHVDSKDLASLDTGSGLSASSTVRHQVNRQHYKYEFTDTQLPLERPYPGVSVKDVPAEKFGFTNDVRQLWSGMIADASWPKPGNWPALLDQMRRAGVGTESGKRRFKARVSCLGCAHATTAFHTPQPNYFTLGASPRLLLAPSSDGSMASVFVWDSPPYECGVQTAGNNDLARQSAFCCSASRGP